MSVVEKSNEWMRKEHVKRPPKLLWTLLHSTLSLEACRAKKVRNGSLWRCRGRENTCGLFRECVLKYNIHVTQAVVISVASKENSYTYTYTSRFVRTRTLRVRVCYIRNVTGVTFLGVWWDPVLREFRTINQIPSNFGWGTLVFSVGYILKMLLDQPHSA